MQSSVRHNRDSSQDYIDYTMQNLALLLSFICCLPVSAQSIMEFGDLRAGAAGTGAGAGMSAGLGHKNALNKSFQKVTKSMTAAQKAAFDQQSQAINQYWASGCQYEVAKQWSNAEKTFAYVLTVITMRDGAKSASRVPVLQKLVTATKAQKKLDQAIAYQKSIADFHKTTSRPDERAIVKAEQELSGLYLDKHDYASAEPVLKDSVALYQKYPTLPKQQRIVTLRTYSTVLRKLKKNDEADKIDKSLIPETVTKPQVTDTAVSTAKPTLAPTPTAEDVAVPSSAPDPVITLPDTPKASENTAPESQTSSTENADVPAAQPVSQNDNEEAVTAKESPLKTPVSAEKTIDKTPVDDPLPPQVTLPPSSDSESKTTTEK